jgi:hypothetical protein
MHVEALSIAVDEQLLCILLVLMAAWCTVLQLRSWPVRFYNGQAFPSETLASPLRSFTVASTSRSNTKSLDFEVECVNVSMRGVYLPALLVVDLGSVLP